MAYRVELAKNAEAELEELYLWVVERAPNQGAAWFNGLEHAILALERFPKRARIALFPSRPTARCPEPQRPYRWDFGKQFRVLAKGAGIQNVRIHDLRYAGATILMTLGVPDPIVRKVTGHRSRELERYQHLTPELRALTVNLIATELFRGKRARKERESGTPTGTVRGRHVAEKLWPDEIARVRLRRFHLRALRFGGQVAATADNLRVACQP